ncbi:MAG: hypothetical protein AMXMBFR64_50360 [Myxococcales bacterium]
MSEHDLLLISLGPVQDFIATARRCQDLWFGSFLLSDLSREAAKAVLATDAEDLLVFPADIDPDKAVANKILARVPRRSISDAVARARSAVDRRLSEHAEAAFGRIDDPDGWFHRSTATEQLKDLVEWMWVSVPVAPGGYKSAREAAEALLARRKLSKLWGQPTWTQGPGVPKSSLDGARESVIDEAMYHALRAKPEERRRRYFVGQQERLCGVGLLKRIGCELASVENEEWEGASKPPGRASGPPVFHSTSHVAAAPLFARIARLKADDDVEVYLRWLARSASVHLERYRIRPGQTHKQAPLVSPLGDGAAIRVPRVLGQRPNGPGYDGSLLYEGQLSAILDEACTDLGAGEERRRALKRRAQEASQELRRLLRRLDLSEPPAYYAFLLADGDRMGAALDRLETPDEHRAVSRQLEAFASACAGIVERHAGSLIYSGGDDVLALLPLHTALQCARALRDDFARKLRTSPAWSEEEADRPTLSVGLGIAHHLSLMSDARKLAKRAETLAKEGGRNSLAIVMDKRSGGTLTVCGAWRDDDQALDRRLEDWALLLRAEELPDRVAFEFEEALRTFEPVAARAAGESPQSLQESAQVARAMVALARGALGRRRGHRGERDLAREPRERLEARLKDLDTVIDRALTGAPGTGGSAAAGELGRHDIAKRTKEALTGLGEELQLAREFLRAWDIAWGGGPKTAEVAP